MKKTSAFQEAKARTGKGEARERERKIMDAMADLLDLDDEETFKRELEGRFGVKPGSPRYQKAMAIWFEMRRGRT